MTISKYLQKNAAEQDTASNTTLSPNEPTESNSSSLSEPKPSVVTAEQTPENKPQKPLGKLLWESFCIILPPVLLLTAVGVVAYYILCPSKGEFHADCTDTLYWAKATYDSGKLIFLCLSAAIWRQPVDVVVPAAFRFFHDNQYDGNAGLFLSVHNIIVLDASANALGFPMELHHSGGIPHASQCQQKTAGNLLGAYHLL